jgi:hypothetical protein
VGGSDGGQGREVRGGDVGGGRGPQGGGHTPSLHTTNY